MGIYPVITIRVTAQSKFTIYSFVLHESDRVKRRPNRSRAPDGEIFNEL
jgi:hypothetical protein